MNEREDFYDNTDDIFQSVKKYEEQLKKNKPLFLDIHTFEDLISYYEMQGQLVKAMEAVDYAIGIYPFSSNFLVKKSSLLMQQKKYNAALRLLDGAEAIDPNDSAAYLLRSDILLIKGKHEEAIEVVRKAMDMVEDEFIPDMWLELADVYEDWGKFNEVFECIKTALVLNPENEEALNRMWYGVELSHRYEDSVEFHQKLIDEHPYSYLAWQNLGQAYYCLDLYEKSIEAYEFVMAIDETYDLAYRDCAEAHFQLRNFHKAIECYQKAIHYSRPSEDLYFCIGECYERMKDYGKARLHYRKVVNMAPQISFAYYRIGLTYKMEKQYHNAQQYFSKAIRIDGSKVTFLVAAARNAFLLQDEDELLNVSEKLLANLPRVKGFKGVEQVISYLVQMDLTEAAMDFISIVEQMKGFTPQLTLLKSVTAFKEGWSQYALELLSQALFAESKLIKKFFQLLPVMKNNSEVLRIADIYR